MTTVLPLSTLAAQNIHFQSCSLANGLSSSNVKCITEDSYGFIWMATQDGLNRFDGIRSNIFNTPQTDGNDVSNLYFDPETKLIWVSYSRGGINAIDTRNLEIRFSLQHFACYRNLKSTAIRAIRLDKRGSLWIGTEEGLYRMPSIYKDSMQRIQLPGIPALSQKIIHLALATDGHIVAAISGEGIADITPQELKIQMTLFNKPAIINHVSSVYGTPELALATSGGVYFYNVSTHLIENADADYGMPVLQNIPYAVVKRGTQFFVATQDGLFSIHPKGTAPEKIEFRTTEKADLRNVATNLYIDHLSHLWIGTMAGCYFGSLKTAPFQQVVTTVSGKPVNHLYYIDHYQGRTLACDETGLYRLSLSGRSLEISDSTRAYFYFFTLPDGRRVCSRQDGLFIWNDGLTKAERPLEQIYPELRPLNVANITNSVLWQDSLILLAGYRQSGIFVWHIHTHRLELIDASASGIGNMGEVYSLRLISKQLVLIGTGSFLLTYNIETGKFKDIGRALAKTSYFFDILPQNNAVFIASYGGGITRLDNHLKEIAHYSTANGLSNNCIYKILPENDSILWASSNYGLNRININSGQISTFFQADGLHSNEFEQFSGAGLDSGVLCFGGLKGLTIVKPYLYQQDRELPVLYLSSVSIQTTGQKAPLRSNDPNQTLVSIPSAWLNAEFVFSAIHFTNPARVNFRYQLLQKDSAWSMLSNGKLTLMGLPPGRYEMQVEASNEDGLWSNPVSIVVEIGYKWFETSWFRLLVTALLLATLYGLYRFRLYQIGRQIAFRKEIAADLHDDIGSTLQSIRVFAHLASIHKTPKYFDQIRLSVKEATTSMRDMIWVLDDEDDSLRLLTDRLKQYAIPLCDASGISFRVIVDESELNHTFTKREKKNLLLILKESVNNAVKYSGTPELICKITTMKSKMVFEIIDSGCGFDLQANQGSGNGMKNLRNRAGQMRAEFEIHSVAGEGTTIRISL